MSAQRILGIDFGKSRIGVAISDELRFLAHPLETLPTTGSGSSATRVAEIARDRDVAEIVVGLPRHLNGTMGAAATDALAFVEKLRAAVQCPVRTWDERLSTVAANRALRDAGKKTRNTRGYVDQVAAQMILQGYLDSLAIREQESERTESEADDEPSDG
jgi:putative Holliday junction resolvase